MGAFLKNMEARFLATGALQHAPKACPVKHYGWNAGVGPWWAATAETFKYHLLSAYAVDPF
jgi:hypothetical protein